MTVTRNNKNFNLLANDNLLELEIKINIYCKVSDQNSEKSTTIASKNTPLQKWLKDKLEEKLTNDCYSLFQKIKNTDCDILKLDERLFRFNHQYYPIYKDNLLEKLKLNLKVNVSGQK